MEATFVQQFVKGLRARVLTTMDMHFESTSAIRYKWDIRVASS